MTAAVDTHGIFLSRVTGPRSIWPPGTAFATFSPPSWPGSFWDETSVSFLRLEEEAFRGVPLPIASEPSRSSDDDCSARGFAGLKKKKHGSD